MSESDIRYAELTEEMLDGRTVHPISACFPMMDVDSHIELADNIQRHGLMSPIVVQGNVILDGRNRLAACHRAGVSPRFVEYSGNVDVGIWILAQGLQRRDLTEDQRVTISLQAGKIIREERKAAKAAKQFKAGNPGDPSKWPNAVHLNSGEPRSKRDSAKEHANSTAGRLATTAGVSRYKAEQALALEKIEEAAPGTIQAVIDGRLNLSKAVSKKKSEPKQKPERSWQELVQAAWKRLFRHVAVADHAKARKLIKELIAKEES